MKLKLINGYTVSDNSLLIQVIDLGLNTGKIYYFTVSKQMLDKMQRKIYITWGQ